MSNHTHNEPVSGHVTSSMSFGNTRPPSATRRHFLASAGALALAPLVPSCASDRRTASGAANFNLTAAPPHAQLLRPERVRIRRAGRGHVLVSPASAQLRAFEIGYSNEPPLRSTPPDWPIKLRRTRSPSPISSAPSVTRLSSRAAHTAWHHPMHLHGHSFRVLSRNGAPTPRREWLGTVLMSPRETVEIAFAADNPGDWMLHCHVLEHQAGGMMACLREV